MSSAAVAFTTFGCVFASTILAMWIAKRLPSHHLAGESRDVVKSGLCVIATLTALVVGLLVASTKGTYDARSGMVKELASQMALLDRVFERHGLETAAARSQLHTLAQAVLHQLWPSDHAAEVQLSGGEARRISEGLFEALESLQPKNDAQRMPAGRASEIMVGMGQIRQRMVVNNERSIPAPLLWVVGLWQAVLFAGYGLIAPRNATTIVVLTICMLSVSGALFLILELDRPFDGMIRISDAPLRTVLSHLGK